MIGRARDGLVDVTRPSLFLVASHSNAFDTVLVLSFPSTIRPNLSLPGPDRLPQLRKLF